MLCCSGPAWPQSPGFKDPRAVQPSVSCCSCLELEADDSDVPHVFISSEEFCRILSGCVAQLQVVDITGTTNILVRNLATLQITVQRLLILHPIFRSQSTFIFCFDYTILRRPLIKRFVKPSQRSAISRPPPAAKSQSRLRSKNASRDISILRMSHMVDIGLWCADRLIRPCG
jgi:hypothetical protein